MSSPLPELEFLGPPVSVAVFQGPIDLLAYLIRRNEVDVQDLLVSEVVGQFVRFVRTMEVLHVEEAAEFLPVAATLVLWKVRSLLPRDEEDEEADDAEAEIEQLLRTADERAAEYRAFREVADHLRQAHQARQQIFLRSYDDEEVGTGWVDLEGVHVFDMIAALQSVLERSQRDNAPVLLRPRWSVRDQMQYLLTTVKEAEGPVPFEQLFADARDRLWIIATFLALLELIRRGRLRVKMDEDGSLKVEPARGPGGR
ncbi:MAG: segregation/condensation protein A [Armatimonadetes bacterium]|nr:segregation/condensation protein A [Armatimonadota bacterium]